MTRLVARALAWTMLVLCLVYLLLPLAVTLLVSFSPPAVFELPHDRLVLRWYERIGQLDGLADSVVLTLEVVLVIGDRLVGLNRMAGL